METPLIAVKVIIPESTAGIIDCAFVAVFNLALIFQFTLKVVGSSLLL